MFPRWTQLAAWPWAPLPQWMSQTCHKDHLWHAESKKCRWGGLHSPIQATVGSPATGRAKGSGTGVKGGWQEGWLEEFWGEGRTGAGMEGDGPARRLFSPMKSLKAHEEASQLNAHYLAGANLRRPIEPAGAALRVRRWISPADLSSSCIQQRTQLWEFSYTAPAFQIEILCLHLPAGYHWYHLPSRLLINKNENLGFRMSKKNT